MTKWTIPLPERVKTYSAPSQRQIAIVNQNKTIEELVLRMLDRHRQDAEIDPRLTALAQTYLQFGFMALTRAVMKPERLDGPLDLSFLEVMAQAVTPDEVL
jgi:hypothetical protein